jgi:hypothetical protein
LDDKLNAEAWTLLGAGFSVGFAAVIGGLTADFHYHAILAVWGAFPILAGCMGGVELLNPLAELPTAESVRTKHRWVQGGIALLVLSVLMGVCGALILASI